MIEVILVYVISIMIIAGFLCFLSYLSEKFEWANRNQILNEFTDILNEYDDAAHPKVIEYYKKYNDDVELKRLFDVIIETKFNRVKYPLYEDWQ